MKEELKAKLRKKGWSEADITKSEAIMDAAAAKTGANRIDLFVYWTGLIVAIILNIIASAVLIPMLFMIRGLALYALVLVIALFFGWVFCILIRDIENMELHHHIITGLFIPAIALVNVFVIVNITNRIIQANMPELLHIPLSQPLQISIIYIIGFTAPYLISKFK